MHTFISVLPTPGFQRTDEKQMTYTDNVAYQCVILESENNLKKYSDEQEIYESVWKNPNFNVVVMLNESQHNIWSILITLSVELNQNTVLGNIINYQTFSIYCTSQPKQNLCCAFVNGTCTCWYWLYTYSAILQWTIMYGKRRKVINTLLLLWSWNKQKQGVKWITQEDLHCKRTQDVG